MFIYSSPRLSTAAKSSPLAGLTVLIGMFALLCAVAMPPSGANAEADSGSICGDSNGDGSVSTSDALGILRFTTGFDTACAPPVCDTNASGLVTVTDALVVLTFAVGARVAMDCPADCGAACDAGIVVGDLQVIDFESLTAGQQIVSVSSSGGVGPVDVSGSNPNANFDESLNAAVVFDSSCPGGCSGGDTDLGSPNQDFGGPGVGDGGRQGSDFENSMARGNIAIIAENLDDADDDGLVDDPDDQGAGPVTMEFDFSEVGPVQIFEITIIDVEFTEMMPLVELFDADGSLIASQSLANTGNNGVGVATIDPNSGVLAMRVSARGSIGIDDIVFAQEMIVSTTTTLAPTTTTTLEPTTTTSLDATTTTSSTSTTMAPTTTTTLAESPIVNFETMIDCAQATTCTVPPCTGSGSGVFSLNTETMEMTFDISFMNLSAAETVSHVHGPAVPGVPAGVQVDLPLGMSKVGTATLTEQQKADMLAELFYVNIHSANCPGGEIRGQILIVDDTTTTTSSSTTTTMGGPTTTSSTTTTMAGPTTTSSTTTTMAGPTTTSSTTTTMAGPTTSSTTTTMGGPTTTSSTTTTTGTED